MAAGPSDKWVYRRPASAQYANVQARRRLQNANRGAIGNTITPPAWPLPADGGSMASGQGRGRALRRSTLNRSFCPNKRIQWRQFRSTIVPDSGAGGSDIDVEAVLSVGIGLAAVATHDATTVAAVPGVAAPSASTTHDATAVGSLTATGLVVGIATRETTTLAAIPADTTANAIASHDATGIAALAAAVAPAATITTSGDFDAVTIAAIGVTLAGIATHDATALGAVAAAGTPTAAVTHDTTATGALPAGSTSSATVTHGVTAEAAIPVALAPAAVATLSATVVAYLAAAFPAAAITTAGRTITADLGAGVALVALVPETSGPVVVARFSERWRLPRAEIAHLPAALRWRQPASTTARLPSAERWRQPEGMDG